MSQRNRKTGLNSAYRRAVRERQESRVLVTFGFVLAAAMAVIYLLTGNNDVEPAPGSISDVSNQQTVDALRAYGRGVPDIQEVDAIIDGTSTN